MMKLCKKCNEEKDLSNFHKNKSTKLGVFNYCKKCHSIDRKNSYDYDKSKNRRLINTYNLTTEEVENLYLSQNKCCKICNKEYPTVSKHGGLYIDHCHTTGKVRGLLCSRCNVLLGNCNDNIKILNAAIDYLNK